jgi:hypothetical protein
LKTLAGDIETMNLQEKLVHVLSWLLAEVEQAQIRGDTELEMRLARIAQAMLSGQQCGCGLETDVEKCRTYVVARSDYPAGGFNSFDTAVSNKNPATRAGSGC